MVIKLSREQKVFFLLSLSPDPKEKGKKFAFLSIHLSFLLVGLKKKSASMRHLSIGEDCRWPLLARHSKVRGFGHNSLANARHFYKLSIRDDRARSVGLFRTLKLQRRLQTKRSHGEEFWQADPMSAWGNLRDVFRTRRHFN